MAISLPSVVVPIGLSAFEIDTPTKMRGATIVLTRIAWPLGPLFTWRVFERKRSGALLLLATADESGGPGFFKDGTPGAPLTITLSWPPSTDNDKIRVEIDALVSFTVGVAASWI
jgi:hypothetical protein